MDENPLPQPCNYEIYSNYLVLPLRHQLEVEGKTSGRLVPALGSVVTEASRLRWKKEQLDSGSLFLEIENV